ncbi:hypothetical protein SAMN05192558_102510 [Actinokineospora alba]|uniref:Uncharacterized protein n=1 Tax=Actinokineospora alba TaxID=504798 RepID=A0A1H0ID43_9PSEU|nr:hypothetical protein [Actinokineospora alba]TDP70990.1 hypothetical protein C8E96_6624 [Actinokineospora alba]SDI88489.1 hypothetical protein SAMN05421871_108209 [Actinokineospora alba]SDO29389.1 hypothetical protein SAMN05192558_102510 [Actinokineospora alba]
MTDAPRRDEPFRFTEEQPEPEPAPAMTWAMRILGLVAVAVLSGVVYWYIQINDKSAGGGAGPQQTTPAPQEGVYKFVAHKSMPNPSRETDCAKHAYDDIQTFLRRTPCESLAQALYTTQVDGKEILVSVSRVRMRSDEDAQALEDLTEQSGTGNISDVVKGGAVKIAGVERLTGNDGYASTVVGRDVTIVEADFAVDAKKYKKDKVAEKLLDDVCADAIRLGAKI